MLIYQTYLIFYIDHVSADLFKLQTLPWNYRIELFVLFIANFILSYTFEWIFIGWFNRYWNNKTLNSIKAEERLQIINDF